MTDKKSRDENKTEERPIVVRNTTDLQRLKLEKLMKNPDKPVIIPEKAKTRSMPPVPDFVRNVMGSSAGAGSGEFHVYRHLRRKEYARQKFIHEKSERDKLDDEYHQKLEDNKRKAEEKTAKKRAKRLKRKQKSKGKGNKKTMEKEESSSESSENESEKEDEITESTEVRNDVVSDTGLQIPNKNDDTNKCYYCARPMDINEENIPKSTDSINENDDKNKCYYCTCSVDINKEKNIPKSADIINENVNLST